LGHDESVRDGYLMQIAYEHHGEGVADVAVGYRSRQTLCEKIENEKMREDKLKVTKKKNRKNIGKIDGIERGKED
jgi:hypothetical protein